MALHPYSSISCEDCSDCIDLFDADGEWRGMLCKQDGDYRAHYMCGDITQLGCHSLWELEGIYDG